MEETENRVGDAAGEHAPFVDDELFRMMRTRQLIGQFFDAKDLHITGGSIRFETGAPRADWKELKREFGKLGYTAYLRRYGDRRICTLSRRHAPNDPARRRERRIALAMFLCTIFTTLGAGYYQTFETAPDLFTLIFNTLSFSIALLLILGSHEMAHKIASRRNGVDSSPPYFIPAPFFPEFSIGTFGAVIRVRAPIPDENAAMELGLSGPVAGFVVAIPVLIIGLMLSQVIPVRTYLKNKFEQQTKTGFINLRNVSASAFSPDGKTLVLGTRDGAIHIAEMRSGKDNVLSPGRAAIRTVAFSPDGKSFYSGSEDGAVARWDARTGRLLERFGGRPGRLVSVAAGADGKAYSLYFDNGAARVREAGTGKAVGSFDARPAIVTAGALGKNGGTAVFGCADGSVILWTVASGDRRSLAARSGAPITSVALSRDGMGVAAGDREGAVFLYDVDDSGNTRMFGLQEGAISSVAFGPGDGAVASSSLKDVVKIWDMENRPTEIMIDPPPVFQLLYSLVLRVPAGYIVNLHPLVLAGWVGLLVTMLNLLPIGQLDGGHIARALLGARGHYYLSLAIIGGLVALGLVTEYYGWFIWGALCAWVFSRGYPPPIGGIAPLRGRNLVYAIIALAIFFLCFMPAPIQVVYIG